MERSTTSLPFLDTTISIKCSEFETKVYRKPTNTGVVINYNSTALFEWKRSLIKRFLMRAYRVSSNLEAFNSEITAITTILINNAYPRQLIERVIQEFNSHHGIDDNNFKRSSGKSSNKPPEDNTSYFTIPYLGKPSIRFQRKSERNFRESGLAVKNGV